MEVSFSHESHQVILWLIFLLLLQVRISEIYVKARASFIKLSALVLVSNHPFGGVYAGMIRPTQILEIVFFLILFLHLVVFTCEALAGFGKLRLWLLSF